jgi:hypothetical protein
MKLTTAIVSGARRLGDRRCPHLPRRTHPSDVPEPKKAHFPSQVLDLITSSIHHITPETPERTRPIRSNRPCFARQFHTPTERLFLTFPNPKMLTFPSQLLDLTHHNPNHTPSVYAEPRPCRSTPKLQLSPNYRLDPHCTPQKHSRTKKNDPHTLTLPNNTLRNRLPHSNLNTSNLHEKQSTHNNCPQPTKSWPDPLPFNAACSNTITSAFVLIPAFGLRTYFVVLTLQPIRTNLKPRRGAKPVWHVAGRRAESSALVSGRPVEPDPGNAGEGIASFRLFPGEPEILP